MSILSNKLNASALVIACMSPLSAYATTNLNVTWLDNSNNEDGFVVERTVMSDNNYYTVAELAANTTSYQDYDIMVDETYCYKISAFNSMGLASSEQKCLTVTDNTIPEATPEPTPEPTPGPTPEPSPEPSPEPANVTISSSFTAKPLMTEIEGKEFYGFNSDISLNEDYSNESITNVLFSASEGTVSYRNGDNLFTDQGNEVENGYASMKFNTGNNLAFDLTGSGENQTATLYMKVGAWTKDLASIEINAGATTHSIVIPKGYSWHYVTANIEFSEDVAVTVSVNGDYAGYSGLMFSGMVLNEKAPQNIADLDTVDFNVGKIVDVSDKKYITANNSEGNDDKSGAEVTALNYLGNTKYRTGTFSFEVDGSEVANGYQGMAWSESNGIQTQITGNDDTTHTASIYIRAGAWTDESPQLEVSINGVSQVIDIAKTRTWFYIRVDVEYTGTADITVKPMGEYGSYSQVAFAGITLD